MEILYGIESLKLNMEFQIMVGIHQVKSDPQADPLKSNHISFALLLSKTSF